ncbi:hypothetical protein XENOCAPTIV_007805 [Xenoophorus captivus]|uniref:Uncharacterized protein n=1 Tax=Xenoophorus captivus TaxID=1517983 RepID=A0ABV0R014_9TELE
MKPAGKLGITALSPERSSPPPHQSLRFRVFILPGTLRNSGALSPHQVVQCDDATAGKTHSLQVVGRTWIKMPKAQQQSVNYFLCLFFRKRPLGYNLDSTQNSSGPPLDSGRTFSSTTRLISCADVQYIWSRAKGIQSLVKDSPENKAEPHKNITSPQKQRREVSPAKTKPSEQSWADPIDMLEAG